MSIANYIQILAFCVLLILGQIFVFDLINITGFGKLMVYPLMLLLIPIHIPRLLVLVIGFVIGYILDFLLGTGGLNAFALTFMAFARGWVLNFLEPTSGYEKSDSASPLDLGMRWFIFYTIILIFIHQFAFYFVERFSFYNILYTLKRIFTGTVLSSFSIILITLLFIPTEGKRKSKI